MTLLIPRSGFSGLKQPLFCSIVYRNGTFKYTTKSVSPSFFNWVPDFYQKMKIYTFATYYLRLNLDKSRTWQDNILRRPQHMLRNKIKYLHNRSLSNLNHPRKWSHPHYRRRIQFLNTHTKTNYDWKQNSHYLKKNLIYNLLEFWYHIGKKIMQTFVSCIICIFTLFTTGFFSWWHCSSHKKQCFSKLTWNHYYQVFLSGILYLTWKINLKYHKELFRWFAHVLFRFPALVLQ